MNDVDIYCPCPQDCNKCKDGCVCSERNDCNICLKEWEEAHKGE